MLPCEAASGEAAGTAPPPPNGYGGDAEALPALVARVLRERLGVPSSQDEPRLEYDWDLGQLL